MNNTTDLGYGWEPCDEIQPEGQLVDGQWVRPAMGCDSLQIALDHLRACLALARAGVDPSPGVKSPAPVAIPLSLRLPEDKDLDDKGRCWYAGVSMEGGYLCWGLQDCAYSQDRYWLPASMTCLPAWPDPRLRPLEPGPVSDTPQ